MRLKVDKDIYYDTVIDAVECNKRCFCCPYKKFNGYWFSPDVHFNCNSIIRRKAIWSLESNIQRLINIL